MAAPLAIGISKCIITITLAANTCFRNLQLKPRKAGKIRKYCSDGKENYEENFFLPILFNNLKNYDAHFVLKHFEKKYVEHHGEDGSMSFDDVEVTPRNSEKYLQFQIGNLRFLDSFQFFSTSLE